ncbi:MAG: hypothetical protein H6822_26060 [Planctomycetaceae bacterium]|nr:hypothetical protein [Planctomycetales bacterium]MCB9925642.1 hypothetical protein [Planctomycetaceae bacterium]
MIPPQDDSTAKLRRIVYTFLIVSSAATMVGRIMSVESRSGKTAMLSANDRSRWCTIRALVDHGTYEIDSVIKRKTDWYTIDMVRHKGADAREHYYSSKPPLLPTLLAGQYWLLKNLAGVTLADNPFYIARIVLVLSNVLPLVLYFVVLGWCVESLGTNDWSRLFVMTCATWGTFLTTFAVTLNNHLPGAIGVMLATYAAIQILHHGDLRGRWFAVAGFFGAFAVANELPALALLAMLCAALLWASPKKTAIAFAPAAAVVAIAFFSTTYIAHQSLRPPYAHRHDGKVVATVRRPTGEITSADAVQQIQMELSTTGIEIGSTATISPSIKPNRWVLWDSDQSVRYALLPSDSGIEVREWDTWYEYEGSYWTPESKTGVDKGESSRAAYAFHTLLGHSGVFSLTPIWLLSCVGIGLWLKQGSHSLQAFSLMVLTLTIVCITFYIMRPEKDRNYGGVSCGFRWLFWLTPLWLVAMLPATDAVAKHRRWKIVAMGLLGMSVFSATYAAMNPWSHSWIFDYWTHLEWIAY